MISNHKKEVIETCFSEEFNELLIKYNKLCEDSNLMIPIQDALNQKQSFNQYPCFASQKNNLQIRGVIKSFNCDNGDYS